MQEGKRMRERARRISRLLREILAKRKAAHKAAVDSTGACRGIIRRQGEGTISYVARIIRHVWRHYGVPEVGKEHGATPVLFISLPDDANVRDIVNKSGGIRLLDPVMGEPPACINFRAAQSERDEAGSTYPCREPHDRKEQDGSHSIKHKDGTD